MGERMKFTGTANLDYQLFKILLNQPYQTILLNMIYYTNFREKEAMAKGEYSDMDGNIPLDIKKKRTLKRIHEWEKFEANCQMLKEKNDEKQKVLKDFQQRRRKSLGHGSRDQLARKNKRKIRKYKSVGYPDQLSP